MLEITVENFEEKVEKSDKPVVIDFWATWCGPCKMQAPIFAKAEDELGEEAVFGKVNVDEQMNLAVRFGVNSIPTIIVMKDGKEASRTVGLQTIEAIEAML